MATDMNDPVSRGVPQDYRKAVRRASWLTLVVMVVVSLFLFLVTALSHLRTDWTEGQVYTLSPSTVSVLDQLEEPLLVRAYITSGLPQPYGRLKGFIEDMLHAYHQAGAGNVGFEVVDPSDDPNLSASLAVMKIPKVQVQVVEDDQAQVKQGYLAVVIEYLDRKEIIPVVQSEAGFEYLLTRKIKKLSGKGRSKIGVLSGFGASTLYGLRKLQEFVSDDYELVEVDAENIPLDIRALVVAGMERAPTEAFRYRLDQFRMRGGGLLLLAGNAKAMLSAGFEVQPIDAGAHGWMKHDLGVAVDAGMVIDQRATRVTVNQQQGGFTFSSLVDYPFLPNVTAVDPEHVVTAGLESVAVPFASPLLWVESEGSSEGGGQRVLMRSSPLSAVQSGPPFDVNPLLPSQERFSGMTLHPSALALAREGALQSSFDGTPTGIDATRHVGKTDSSRMIVVGSPSLLDDEFMDGGNLVAVLNILDWISGDEALINLRSRGVTQRPLEELSSAGRSFFKGMWMFGLPILIALTGVLRWWVLRRRRTVSVS
ncbi:MAG: GldG family protein [Mariprofundaceae bacterium]|nr:GldG family protein [Mariprofundaceae bacterium]